METNQDPIEVLRAHPGLAISCKQGTIRVCLIVQTTSGPKSNTLLLDSCGYNYPMDIQFFVANTDSHIPVPVLYVP